MSQLYYLPIENESDGTLESQEEASFFRDAHSVTELQPRELSHQKETAGQGQGCCRG